MQATSSQTTWSARDVVALTRYLKRQVHPSYRCLEPPPTLLLWGWSLLKCCWLELKAKISARVLLHLVEVGEKDQLGAELIDEIEQQQSKLLNVSRRSRFWDSNQVCGIQIHVSRLKWSSTNFLMNIKHRLGGFKCGIKSERNIGGSGRSGCEVARRSWKERMGREGTNYNKPRKTWQTGDRLGLWWKRECAFGYHLDGTRHNLWLNTLSVPTNHVIAFLFCCSWLNTVITFVSKRSRDSYIRR